VQQQHKPGGALDERADSTAAVLTQDEVAFPMTGNRPIVDL
jgi:hypothetical protein